MEVRTEAISSMATLKVTVGMNSMMDTTRVNGEEELTTVSAHCSTRTEVATPVVSMKAKPMGWERSEMLTAPFEEESGTKENLAILNDNIMILITKF
jgi:hypothetical protein